MTSMISHENPASFVVNSPVRERKMLSMGSPMPSVNVEEEITLQASARNLESAYTTFRRHILPHCRWTTMKTSTTLLAQHSKVQTYVLSNHLITAISLRRYIPKCLLMKSQSSFK